MTLEKIKFLNLKCQLCTLNIFCFFLQNQYASLQKPEKRSKSNWNEANIENQYVQPQNPAECQKQHFEIDLKCKKRERHWWRSWRKIVIWEQKEKQLADCIKTLCDEFSVMLVLVPRFKILKKLCDRICSIKQTENSF